MARPNLLPRRAFLALPLAALAPVPAGNRLTFQVVRNGEVIGSHVLVFTPRGDGVDIGIEVEIRVKFGPIRLYHYQLSGTEIWRGGQMVRASAMTDDDGTADMMQAERDERGLWVSGSAGARYLAPPDAVLATHWNQAELRGPWINPHDGKLLRPTVAAGGADAVLLASGRSVAAERFDLSGEVQMQMWYSAARQWMGLAFRRGGALVRYELV